MAYPLDHDFLRNATSKDVALHLHQIALSKQHSNGSITQHLLEAIESESLPPMVYALWTSSCPDHKVTVAGMRQSHSIIVRSSAIRNFRRRFRTADCESLWRAMGGTSEIAQLLAQFSVIHVKEFCKAVARCSTSKSNVSGRQVLVTQLLLALTDGSAKHNPDERSLPDLYAKMIYTCTTNFKDAWMSRNDTSSLDMAKIFETDVDLYRKRCLESLAACNGTLGIDFGRYSPLFHFIPQEPDESDSGISGSMAFAVRALESIRNLGISTGDADWLYNTMSSLLRRFVRKQVPSELTLRFLEAMGYCTQKRFSNRFWRGPLDRQYCLNIIKLWQRDPAVYGPKLAPLLRGIDFCWKTITSVRREDRYRLLSWVLAAHCGIDIEDDAQLKGKNILKNITGEIMLSLPSTEAVQLFDRCELVRPASGWSEMYMLKIDKLDKAGAQIPVELARLHLLEDVDEALSEGRIRTMHCRQMAENTGSQPVRSAWINAALYFAVASKSLHLFQDTVVWARRFSRDPKTALELYAIHPFGGPVFHDKRTVALLSGIPAEASKNTTLASVGNNVRKGNEILLDLLQSAALVENEASFKRDHWDRVFLLPKEILSSRLEHINHLQSRLKLTDDQVFSSIWQDTLTMLLKAEEFGLTNGNEPLKYNHMEGPLRVAIKGKVHQDPLRCPSTPTMRFIDELAVRRDGLWTHHRVDQDPTVTKVEPPWPRGLPIQAHWIPDDIEIPHYKENAKGKAKEQRTWVSRFQGRLPFLEKRVEDIVFMPPGHAQLPVPNDKEIQSAILPFVDRYAFALKRYFLWCSSTERNKRLHLAWEYATKVLSGDRMSALESRHYWKDVFLEAGAKLTTSMLQVPSHSDPQLPLQEDHANGAAEWFPGSDANLDGGKRRQLDALVVDCFRDPRNSFKQASISPVIIAGFWDLDRYRTKVQSPRNRSKTGAFTIDVPNKAREAFIAAALLLVDGRAEGGSNLLEQPFPSAFMPRFPALFLDAAVLYSKTPSDDDVGKILERFLPAIPSSLLKRLAENLTERSLGGSALSKTQRQWTSFILRLLVMSDKPGFAIQLMVRVVLDTPGETPWHRVLLHSGVLKRMPSGDVKSLVSGLTNGIALKLSQQHEAGLVNEGDVERQTVAPGPYTPMKPAVKVTTVKMVAQILRNASFLGDDFILQALVSLFRNATHIHVRAAIVDSLTELLRKSRSVSVSETIVGILESQVVPVAAELNERSPMTEERWKIAEESCEPPEVYSEIGLGPICKAVMRAVKLSRRRHMRSHKLVERLLLPLIRKSRENNSRWASIFFRKHDASDLAKIAPACPAKPQLLEFLHYKFTAQMPASEFANLSDILLFAAYPPESYTGLATKLKDHPQAYDQHDALHWLCTTDGSQFTEPERRFRGARGSQEIVKMLKEGRFASPDQAAAHDLVTPAHLQIHEQRVLSALLTNYATKSEVWERQIEFYKPPVEHGNRNLEVRIRWRQYCQPLVQHAVSIIEAASAQDLQRDPQRRPCVLPDAWQLQVWLLPHPRLYPPFEHDERLNNFMDEVWELVQNLALSSKPYHERWPILAGTVHFCPREDYAPFVLRFGRFADVAGRDLTLAECLCVDMIEPLLWKITATHETPHVRGYQVQGEAQAVCEMLGTWEQCLDQGARRTAAKYMKRVESCVQLGWDIEPDDENYGGREFSSDFEDCPDYWEDHLES